MTEYDRIKAKSVDEFLEFMNSTSTCDICIYFDGKDCIKDIPDLIVVPSDICNSGMKQFFRKRSNGINGGN